ncbi:hypothetical protein [Lysinibacter cavernae]|uniref:LPXTG cell wall anchor domain-containing protein n=1 Tax=Lysinibacter cavernae TaxID=1640652 RepID=A0A7X5R373_9MICO|nr:hypothetical protein [Lysinibacter cavernae]NIH54839.1 hypothetical protein [Lysinibacter cavernae]
MKTKTSSFTRVGALAAAASIAFVGLSVSPALAAPVTVISADAATSDAAVVELMALFGGTVTVNYPAGAGLTVEVESRIPGSDATTFTSAVIAADGTASVAAFAGPVSVVIGSTSIPDNFAEINAGSLIVNRGAVTALNNVDFAAGTAVAATGAAVIPTNGDELVNSGLEVVTDYNFTPASYLEGEAFTINVTDLIGLDGKSYEGETVTTYAFSDRTDLGAQVVSGNAFSVNVPASLTTGSHSVVSFDQFGLPVVWINMNGGYAAPEAPAPAVPGSNTGATNTGGLAETGGMETIALLLSALGAAAAGATLMVRSRRA